jgi:glucosamine 6-phosphate synthetase-like amidotransferase/phosphosugar isomerase protein
MCGIMGVIGPSPEGSWHRTHDILTHLFRGLEIRGKDASGFSALSERRTLTAKMPMKADKFVETPAWRNLRRVRCSMVICHARLATTGSPARNENNHPHVSGSLHLVHNGVVPGHWELAHRFRLPLTTECDSETLLRIIERAKTVPLGMTLCLTERPGAIVVLDARRRVCWMGTDVSRPLWVGRPKGYRQLFFASTSGILMDGIESALQQAVTWDMLVPLAPNHIYAVSEQGAIGAVYEEPIVPKIFSSLGD